MVHTIELLLWDLPRCSQLLQIAPVFKTHQGSWDKVGTLRPSSIPYLLSLRISTYWACTVPVRRKVELDPNPSEHLHVIRVKV